MNATPEEWRPIVGYEGRYEVSNLGHVRSLDRVVACRNGQQRRRKGIVLKQTPDFNGRPLVSLGAGTQNKKRPHRLVAEAFHGPGPQGMEVCHNDGDPWNNRADNLRWDTRSGNHRDKKRHGTDPQSNKTHCPRRHEYTAENTYVGVSNNGGPARMCRACIPIRRQEARAKRVANQQALMSIHSVEVLE